MSLNNWYPFYVGDYMRDTAHLSMLEHGAYRLLLDHYYSTGQPLPDDEKQLHRICRAFDEQEQIAIKRVLQLFFLHDAKAKIYTQGKVQKELNKKADISSKRAQAAKNKGKNQNANAEQMQSKCRAIDDTSTSTSTILSKDSILRPSGVSIQVWEDFINHRKNKKAKLTQTALNGIITQSQKAGWSLEDALTEICSRGWTGFKAEWVKEKTNGNKLTRSEQADEATRRARERILASEQIGDYTRLG